MEYNIHEELLTQDNLATKDPLFVVYEYEEVVIPENVGNVVGSKYYCAGACESFDEDSVKDLLKEDDVMFSEENFEEIAKSNEYEKYYYTEIKRFVTCCFTRKGAERYIRLNNHNLHKAHIYVHGIYRNQEMIEIRDGLLEGKYA